MSVLKASVGFKGAGVLLEDMPTLEGTGVGAVAVLTGVVLVHASHGLVLAVCTHRTQRLGMAIAAHMAFNATGLIMVANS